MKYLLFLLVFGCTTTMQPSTAPKNWGIQLQNYTTDSLRTIQKSKADLWVLDAYERSDKPFSSLQTTLMKQNGKKLIAYMSIGEAENYRPYFKHLDSKILGPENPHWKGNFTVSFWDPAWEHVLIEEYLPVVLESGFDGVFLDVIDAFERFPDKAEKAEEMARLINHIAIAARKQHPDFQIILQNGLQIRRWLHSPQALLDSIQGINLESGFQASTLSDSTKEDIAFYQKYGKYVLSLEYPKTKAEVDAYFKRARAVKLIPAAATPALNGSISIYSDESK